MCAVRGSMRLIIVLVSVCCLMARGGTADTPSVFRKISGVKEDRPGVCSVTLKLESPPAEHIADADIIEAEYKGDETQPLVVSIEPLVQVGRATSALKHRELVTLKDFKGGRTLSLPFTCDPSLQGVTAYGIFLCAISKFDTSAQRCADAYAVDMGRRSQDVRVAALSTTFDIPERLFVLKDSAPELGGSKTFFFAAIFRDSSGAFYIPPDLPYQDAVNDVRTFLALNKTDPTLIERIVFKGAELERVIGSYPPLPLEDGSGIIMRLPHSK